MSKFLRWVLSQVGYWRLSAAITCSSAKQAVTTFVQSGPKTWQRSGDGGANLRLGQEHSVAQPGDHTPETPDIARFRVSDRGATPKDRF